MSSVKKKLLHLQGLRGIAILAVIAFHFFPNICKNGYLGVDMFFLLSGYLMTMMLDRVKSISIYELLDFWYRRFKRILPYYYLVIFGIVVVLFGLEGTVRSANVDPAFYAIVLATNLIRPDGDADYFEKLGTAVDMFTHTWSLALEMQFYLIFPFIFLIFKLLPHRLKPISALIIGILSFVYHISSDDFNSFNNAFARIWQFLAGTAAFYADEWISRSNRFGCDDEGSSIHVKNSTGPRSQSDFVIMNAFIFALLALFAIPQEIAPLYARINSILISFVIVAYGKNCCLENSFLVFIGEISYGWYLVHWPVYAWLKVQEHTSVIYLFGGVIFSLILAILLHYSFEKHYLSWSKITVFSAVALLLLLNASGMFYMKTLSKTTNEQLTSSNTTIPSGIPKDVDPRFYFPSDFLENIVYGFENMTVKERIDLNTQYDYGDGKRTHAYCTNRIKTNISFEWRCEMNDIVNKTANNTFLMIGNSWVGNMMRPVAESCSHRFSYMEAVYELACEALFPSFRGNYWHCEHDHMYMDAVKRLQPDVLMIMQRYIDSQVLRNGTSPFNDYTYMEGIRRLQEYDKYVKKAILIVDAFPWPKRNVGNLMNSKLKGEKVADEENVAFDKMYFTVKQRIARVISGCKKCKVFDLANQFWFNGRFRLYEPKYLVSFMTSSMHFSPAGWLRLKPLLKHVCDNI